MVKTIANLISGISLIVYLLIQAGMMLAKYAFNVEMPWYVVWFPTLVYVII